jgi:hypothetical protein
MTTQGKGKSAKEILKRIDYFGSLFLMLSVHFYLPFIPVNTLNLIWFKGLCNFGIFERALQRKSSGK